MIYDTFDQAQRYERIHPDFQKAFDFLKSINADQQEGKYKIDGDRVFAGVDRYQTKDLTQVQFEAHRRYVDVQMVLKGEEDLWWAPLKQMEKVEIVRPFDVDKDVMKWGVPEANIYCKVPLIPGRIAILFPDDAHAPGVRKHADQPVDVLKVVVKVALD